MQPQRDLAIVLRSIPYEDRHRIVTALTENHGRVTALARNSIQSRRFGPSLDLFSAGEWLFVERPGAELWSLREVNLRRTFEGLSKHFERLSLASAFNEIMLKVAPQHEACPDLFRLHSNALVVLEELKEEGAEVRLLNAYLAKILQWNGTQPRLLACILCETPLQALEPEDSLSCRVADASWVCPKCRGLGTAHVRDREGEAFDQSLLRISPLAALDFHVSLNLPIRQVPEAARATREEHLGLYKFLEALFAYHIPGFDKEPLKSLRFLELESSEPRPPTNFPRNPLRPVG